MKAVIDEVPTVEFEGGSEGVDVRVGTNGYGSKNSLTILEFASENLKVRTTREGNVTRVRLEFSGVIAGGNLTDLLGDAVEILKLLGAG